MNRGGYTRGSTSGNTRENRSSLKDVLEREQVDDIYTSNACEVILTLENSDLKWFSDANYIASRHFEPYDHYPLKGSNNTRLFYETILKETQSVEFEHFSRGGNTQQNKHAPYSFSKASFKKMLSPTDWGLDPNRTRQMTNYPNMPYTASLLYHHLLGHMGIRHFDAGDDTAMMQYKAYLDNWSFV